MSKRQGVTCFLVFRGLPAWHICIMQPAETFAIKSNLEWWGKLIYRCRNHPALTMFVFSIHFLHHVFLVCMSREKKVQHFSGGKPWNGKNHSAELSCTLTPWSCWNTTVDNFRSIFMRVMHYWGGPVWSICHPLIVTFTVDIFPGILKYLWGSDARQCCFSVNSWHSIHAAIYLKRLSALCTICLHKQQGIFSAWIITKGQFLCQDELFATEWSTLKNFHQSL